MQEQILAHLAARFLAHRELISALPEETLQKTLPLPSNSIGAQYWCVIGARESYTQAIRDGEWVGFQCSLSSSDVKEKQKVLDALDRSAANFAQVADQVEWTKRRIDLLLDLFEHETQHQGQMIRYVYGLGLHFPQSWIDRWALG
ncbi:MAG: hypothetical protein WD740_08325 [Anaerolineales bacterium]